MKKFLFFLIFCPVIFFANEPFYSFSIPKKWDLVSTKDFAKSVKVGCIAKSKNTIKPSINLATEYTKKNFEEYIQAAKNLHIADRKNTYTSLGYLSLKHGKAYLSQIETKSKCGDIRILQCLFMKDHIVYILTGVCEKQDYLNFYDEFILAFESFEIANSPFETIKDLSKENLLKNRLEAIKASWQTLQEKYPSKTIDDLFLDKTFQKKTWKSFEKFLTQTFKDKGLIWQIQASAFYKKTICS